MIVIDTNILAYHELPQADAALHRAATKVMGGADRILLPTLWRYEFLNILAGYAKTGLLSRPEAEDAWHRTVALAQQVEAPVDMMRALELAKETGISGYDAQFLALAEGARTVLVTEDRRLRKAAGDRALSMQEYLASR